MAIQLSNQVSDRVFEPKLGMIKIIIIIILNMNIEFTLCYAKFYVFDMSNYYYLT